MKKIEIYLSSSWFCYRNRASVFIVFSNPGGMRDKSKFLTKVSKKIGKQPRQVIAQNAKENLSEIYSLDSHFKLVKDSIRIISVE